MTKKNLTLENVEPLLLFGSNDRYLKKVEAAFPDTKITARGNRVVLQGSEKAITSIERILNELVSVLKRNKSLTENDVETVLAIKSNGNGTVSEGDSNGNVILHTPSGNVIKAKTPNQKRLVASAKTHDLIFAIGPAGTGKTYTGVALAVQALKSKEVKRIILTRPAVEAGENLGFLPGDLKEKLDPYMQPLYDALRDMIPHEKLDSYIEKGVIQIAPLAFMRGRTLDNAFVILDEGQNTTHAQMKMFLTRMGKNAKFLLTGDPGQVDLPRRTISGLKEALLVLKNIEGIGMVYLDDKDVIRHKLVKKVIAAYKSIENRD